MRFKQSLVAALLGIAATLTMLLGMAQPASAHAAGNSQWGEICFRGECIPSGTLLHVIDGTGIALAYDRAQMTTAWPVCNWWVDFDYYDNAGERYRHIQGEEHNYCTVNGHVRFDYGMGPHLWKPGRACATLYSASHRLTRQCHYLHN